MTKINFNPFPNLSTERLSLRQLGYEDEKEIYALRSDDRVTQYIARPNYKTLKEAKDFIEKINGGIRKNEWLFWGITFKNDSKLIGTACIWNINIENQRAEIGYDLLSDFHGKGIMNEAIKAVIDYGFGEIGLHSIEAHVNPNNMPSIKLLERNSFVREAYFKENVYYDGNFLDTVIYSLINPNTY